MQDVFFHRVVGWAMTDHMQTSLVESALHTVFYSIILTGAANMPAKITNICSQSAALQSR